MRPTVHDVAREAKVSLATVDRVLNKRPGVRAATVERVEAAIATLGYVRDMAAANMAKQKIYDLAFIVPEGTNTFMRGLQQTLEGMADHLVLERTRVTIVNVPAFDGAALAAAIDRLAGEGVSGLALVATETPDVRAALERLAQADIPVVTLVSDYPDARRDHYVGIDNVAAGRSAASLLGRFSAGRTGKVLTIAGSLKLRDHIERHAGFDEVIRSEFPHLASLPVLEGNDSSEETQRVIADCLAREKDVVALYNIGAGNRGVIAAVKQASDENDSGRISVVGHELTAHTRQALQDGLFDAVINQDAAQELRSAIALLRARIDGRVLAAEPIRIEIYIRDNLP